MKFPICSYVSLAALCLPLVVGACSSAAPGPRASTSPPSAPAESAAAAEDVETQASPLVLAAAGDIADCGDNDGAGAKATAKLLESETFSEVLALGDLVYTNGTEEEFSKCYDKVWGGLKDRTRPAPGNHDYGIYGPRRNAKPYFKYFGVRADPEGKGNGFYSFDRGAWHIVSLNSMAGKVASAPSMEDQVEWLKGDLANTQQPCILAFWHHPLFSSGAEHGDQEGDPGRLTGPLWDELYKYRADVIVNGHDHGYERFARQRAEKDGAKVLRKGVADDQGILQFVVGTGGAHLYSFLNKKKPNHEVGLGKDSNVDNRGVLFLTLHDDGYEWKFKRVDGAVADESSQAESCHPKTPKPQASVTSTRPEPAS